MAKRDFYDVLGVSRSASAGESVTAIWASMRQGGRPAFRGQGRTCGARRGAFPGKRRDARSANGLWHGVPIPYLCRRGTAEPGAG